jgi:uncharacterized membrane protein
MKPKVKREELDGLAEFYSLDDRKVETLLDLATARPSRAEGLKFLGACLRIGGVLSLATGLVFFVAANWGEIEVFGRFALLELLLVACAAAALWKPPPTFVGHGTVFLAFIATGALLALFGQTYQTGADVYELFLAWALLGLPLVVAGSWSVTSAAWVLVLNVALLLFCGWHPVGGLLWALLNGAHFRVAHLVLGAAWLNLALWFAFELWRVDAVPDWVRRLMLSCAFAFGTWSGVLAVADDKDPLAVLGLAAAMAAVVVYAMRRRTDVYPLAVVMGTFIIVSLVWLADAMRFDDEGTFLMMALWLIGTSTAAGKILTVFTRRWRVEGAA